MARFPQGPEGRPSSPPKPTQPPLTRVSPGVYRNVGAQPPLTRVSPGVYRHVDLSRAQPGLGGVLGGIFGHPDQFERWPQQPGLGGAPNFQAHFQNLGTLPNFYWTGSQGSSTGPFGHPARPGGGFADLASAIAGKKLIRL